MTTVLDGEDKLILHITIKRRLVPYKDKHEVSIAIMNKEKELQLEGLLHNIHDLDYDYQFEVSKDHFTNQNEVLYVYLMVGGKTYPISLKEEQTIEEFSFNQDMYQQLYLQKGDYNWDENRSLLVLTPMKLTLNEKNINITIKKPDSTENMELTFYDQATKTICHIPILTQTSARLLKLHGTLEKVPKGSYKWEIILGVLTGDKKDYYRLTATGLEDA